MRARNGLLNLAIIVTIAVGSVGCRPGLATVPGAGPSSDATALQPGRTASDAAWGRLPLYFIENRGQVDQQVAFTTHKGNLAAFFTAGGVTFGLAGGPPVPVADDVARPGANGRRPADPGAAERALGTWTGLCRCC